MRIGVDARLFGLEHTGIGRYVMELVCWLIKLDRKNEYVVFVPLSHVDEIHDGENVKVVPVDVRHYTLLEQVKMPKVFYAEKLDLLHVPHFNVPLLLRIPFVVTIHDLLWHEVMGYSVTTLNPAMYSLKYLAYRLVMRHAVMRSRKIITPSRWVKAEVIKRFGVSEKKVFATYEGVDRSFFRKPKGKLIKCKKTRLMEKPFLVYTGSLYPHKDVVVLIKALRKVNLRKKRKIRLLIVSSRSVFVHKLKQLAFEFNQSHLIKFAGFLPDGELVQVYKEAVALVNPSKSEGFGLPGLEAMACGLPVISSNAGSLPEVYGEAALYFKVGNVDDLAEKIDRVVGDKKFARTLSKIGVKQALKYSFKKMAQETIEVYESVVKAR